jgi:hypothetical protein
MKSRVKWSQKDLIALRQSYQQYPYRVPLWLLKRHKQAGCHTKAFRLGYTHGVRNGGLDLRKLTVAEKAYLAAFIDGEGSIMMNYDKPRTNPHVSIANTDKNVLYWIQKRFTAGQLCVTHRNRHNPKWKDVYQLSINGIKNVYDVLRAIEPYLIIKKDKARRAMRYLRDKYSL